jgi:hypothetical protein
MATQATLTTMQTLACRRWTPPGQMDPNTDKLLIDSIGAFAGLKQIGDLEARLTALEGKR